MFAFSFRHSRRRAVIAVILAAAAAAGAWAAVSLRSAEPQAEAGGKKYSLSAATNDERVAFFRQFGWEAVSEPIDSGEVTIPETFSDVYLQYNNLQKEQGLDLRPYAGITVSQWIYRITNYPERPAMRGTLLVADGRVIGGDLSTPELNGFMTGFDGVREETDGCEAGAPVPARTAAGRLTDAAASAQDAAASAEEAEPVSSSEIPANAWPTD